MSIFLVLYINREQLIWLKKQETKATGVETKPQTVPQDTGVTAILKAKHPELFN